MFIRELHFLKVFALLLVVDVINGRVNQMQCTRACLTSNSNNASLAFCQMCSDDPPVGLQMCAVACRYPEHQYLLKIAEVCAKTVELTDRMCIVACMNNDAYPHFKQICTRCRHNPPITGNMCLFACDHDILLSTVCATCAYKPPKNKRLCNHACEKASFSWAAYYKKICTACEQYAREKMHLQKYIFRNLDN